MSISPHIAENRSGQAGRGDWSLGTGTGTGLIYKWCSRSVLLTSRGWRSRRPPFPWQYLCHFCFIFSSLFHTTSQVKATAIALAIIVPFSRDHLSLEAANPVTLATTATPTHSARLDLSPKLAEKENKRKYNGWVDEIYWLGISWKYFFYRLQIYFPAK